MSYDITFIRKSPDQSWDDALEAHEEKVASESVPLEFDEITREKMERVADSAVRLHPAFERSDSAGWIELTDADTGLQVHFYPSEVAITVPYWHDDAAAGSIAALMRQLAQVIERETGLEGYDPQQGVGILDVEWKTLAAGAEMGRVARMLHGRGQGDVGGAQRDRPWWKFW